MKHIPMYLVFCLIALLGCQQKSSKKTSSTANNPLSACEGLNYYSVPGCGGYAGSTIGGTVSGSTTGTTVNGSGNGNVNPYPNYSSFYADKNWQVKYPYAPPLNCSTPVTPSGITYTPYETRKGTVTVVGAGFGSGKNPADPKSWYDPRTYVTISDDRTSALLRNPVDAQKFFWTDSALKVRLKANFQPDSSQSNPLCAGRVPNMSWIKGYTRLKFDLFLIGLTKDQNGNITTSTEEVLVRDMVIDVNTCSSPIDLKNHNGTNYPSKYPDGLFLVVKYVKGNQNWSPGTYNEQQAWDTWGFYPNSYYNGNSYMQAIRSNDCWSIDFEVAADGTKTF